MDRGPFVFGIRHLSPAGAYYVREFLDKIQPELVLIEGPSDFTELMEDLAQADVRPPVAVMAYTRQLPVRTILYPFAEYSPEYQALLWAKEHGRKCRFCDLPSDVFLGLLSAREAPGDEETGSQGRDGQKKAPECSFDVYQALDRQCGDGDHETFWERTIEQSRDMAGYQKGAKEFGSGLRQLELCLGPGEENSENLAREAYMRRMIEKARTEGISEEKMAVITGAFHAEGILCGDPAMTDKEFLRLPRLESMKTLMPYSYYRLSQRSGYGAGNHAPAYYEYLWQGFLKGEADYAARRYLSGLGEYERTSGGMVSAAEVMEALRLSQALAGLRGGKIPALRDLRDGAVTCMGHGRFSKVSLAVASVEIGTKIGSLPQGVSQTSIQSDFYEKLRELRLEKYKSVTASSLNLDLSENLRVKTKKAAFMDLERSFFLHRLRVLNIRFGTLELVRQDNATWAERWVLQWTPETEIRLVETVLKGDTLEQAAAFELKGKVEESQGIGMVAKVVAEAFYCGMPLAVHGALAALQAMAVDAAALGEIGDTVEQLSVVLQYGDIRRLDRQPLIPIVSQLFLRACLILPQECACDDQAAAGLVSAIGKLHQAVMVHDFLDRERFVAVLSQISSRDDLNTRLSGAAASILLEMGAMDSQELGREVERRLSKGIPAQLGAGWFSGLSSRNHYALIARLTLWEKLSAYLDTLDDEEFKRALLFLRRAFADFAPGEKDQIAENLGEIWQVNPMQVSEMLNESLTEDAMEFLGGLEDFDFGDI